MLATIGIVFYQSTVSSQQALAWQRHSQDIIYRLDEILYLTHDSEAAVRGYAMVGSDTYLEPHRRAENQIRQNLGYLRQRFGENKPQLDELDRLQASVSEYFAIAADTIETRATANADSAAIKFSPQRVKTATNGLRVSIEKLKADESTLLDRRQKGLSESLYMTIWILIVSTIAGLAALALANLLVVREFGRRRVAEGALIEANQDLELKIAERTERLEAVNETLLQIGGEREELLFNEKSARREAEIANRLRDEFMATVSHELRTPLNSILGWARLLKDGSLDDSQQEKAVSTIIRSSENQNRLIEDLLDVARLISGKLRLEFEEVDLAEVVEHSVESLSPVAEKKGVKIEFKDRPEEKCIVEGDRNRLVQVFSNLIDNGIKFSGERAKIDVSMLPCDGKATVIVRDEGIGISAEFLPSVFERFRQDAEREGQDNAGLGLGLAIVRNLVELHNGSVAVTSDGEGKGSEFTVTLPLFQNETSVESNDAANSLEQVVGDDVGLNV